jgi:acetyl esterase/lipase
MTRDRRRRARWISFVAWGILGALAPLRLAASEAGGPERRSLWEGRAPIGDGQFEDADATITVHRPQRPNGTAVVICPGGGYGALVVEPEGHGIAAWLNRHGITGVVLEYRLPVGRSFVPLLDAQRALRTVRANAEAWGLDPARIGIMGFSAGGHLASTALTHFDEGDPMAADPLDRPSCRPDFGVLVYPVVTMGEQTHAGSRRNLLGESPTADLVELFSNEKQVSDRTPPVFLAHAVDDGPVPPENSRALYAALKAHGVPTKYLELPSGGHGLDGYQGPMWDAWQAQSLAWLAEQRLLPEDAAAPIVARDVPYAEPADERQVLDVYAPAGASNLPVVFWIHGGGWQAGDKTDVQIKPRVFAERGFVFVSINYRLLPDVPMEDIIGDVARAAGWVHAHIAEYGGDPQRLLVMGHSAGAQLAALLSTDDRYLKAAGLSLTMIRGCVPVDGDTYDVPAIIETAETRRRVHGLPQAKFGHREKFGNDPAKHRDFSAVTHVASDKGIPPFLILHVAEHPDVSAQAQRLGNALQEAGVPVQVFGASDTTHGRINANLGQPDDPATRVLFEFLDKSLQE